MPSKYSVIWFMFQQILALMTVSLTLNLNHNAYCFDNTYFFYLNIDEIN